MAPQPTLETAQPQVVKQQQTTSKTLKSDSVLGGASSARSFSPAQAAQQAQRIPSERRTISPVPMPQTAQRVSSSPHRVSPQRVSPQRISPVQPGPVQRVATANPLVPPDHSKMVSPEIRSHGPVNTTASATRTSPVRSRTPIFAPQARNGTNSFASSNPLLSGRMGDRIGDRIGDKVGDRTPPRARPMMPRMSHQIPAMAAARG